MIRIDAVHLRRYSESDLRKVRHALSAILRTAA